MNNSQIEFITAEEVAALEGLTLRQVNGRCSNSTHKQRLCGAEQVTINGVKTWKVPVNSISFTAHYKLMQQRKIALEGRQLNSEKPEITADLCEKRSAVLENAEILTAYPVETVVSTSELTVVDEINCRLKVGKRSAALDSYLTVTQVSELEDKSLRTIRDRCNNGIYKDAKKEVLNGGEGWLIPVSNLSKIAQKAYTKKFVLETLAESSIKDVVVAAPASQDMEYSQLWDRYERKDTNFKRMANDALDILLAYLALKETGVSVGFAEKAIEESHGAARSTIRRYLDYTKKHPRQHWLPLLCPQYHGGRARAEFTPEAYAFLLALKIKSPATKLSVLMRETAKEGEDKGWIVPGRDTVSARLDEEPAWIYGGMVALERGFPTVERDYSNMSLHECWESDGRRADVFCRWDDGTITRPFVIAIRDVRSRRVLAIRVCRDPDTEAVLGAFGAAMANTQAIPRYFKLDNGREYANKMFTGHQTTRYRNKYKIDEAIGILTLLDVKVHWSKPGNGRDKPIESWWNVIAENCDKNPMFAGAYCGKDVLSKPEDHHKDKAAPVEAYGAKLVETIKENEHRPHRGHGMNGRSAYEVSEELALTTVTRKPNASELRRCKMGVKSLSLDKKDSSIRFKMDGFDMPMKYWNEALADLSVAEREGKFNVYFDWGEPNTPVSVYRGDVFICDAAPLGRIDFIEAPENGQVKEHMETKGKFMKQRKNAINAAKQGGSIALPSVNSPMSLPPMIAATQSSIIAPSTKIRAIAPPPKLLQPVEGSNEFISTKTGKIYPRIDLEAQVRQQQEPGQRTEEEKQARLEELKRRQYEKTTAHLKVG